MRSRYQHATVLVAGLISLLLALPAVADMDELFKIAVGTRLTNFDTDLAINSNDGSVGTEIDLEDDLNFNSTTNTLWISGWYRVGDKHRLKLTFIPLRRSTNVISERDLVIEGSTIKAGAAVSAQADANIYDFRYIYSLIRRPKTELGLAVGVYWFRTDTSILAAGEVQGEGEDSPSFKSDFVSSQRIHAPMPLIGLSWDYEFTPAWRTHLEARYLAVSIDEISGSILATEASAEYYFNRNWGLGLSASYFNTNVDVQGLIFNGSLSFAQSGAQIYGVYKH